MNTFQGGVKEGDVFFTSRHSPVKHAVPGGITAMKFGHLAGEQPYPEDLLNKP